MAPPPPSHNEDEEALLRSTSSSGNSAFDWTSSASVSRTKSSEASVKATVDEMLRQSLLKSRGIPPTGLPSASTSLPLSRSSLSVSQSTATTADIRKMADAMLRQSVINGSASSTSSASSHPLASRGFDNHPSAVPARSLPVDPVPPYSSQLQRQASSAAKSTASSITLPQYSSKRSTAVGPSLIKPVDLRQLKVDLQREIDLAAAEKPQRDTKGIFKAACSTDLLFLIDTTASMTPYIESVKNQVKSIIDDIKKVFLGEAQVRIAVVSYRDHDLSPNIEFLDFTTSIQTVRNFVDKLAAAVQNGKDIPEDVLGGLKQTVNASWQQQNRCLIHLGDAPPHGRTLHDMPKRWDNYYDTGSEPHGLTHERLLERLIQLKVNYAFLRITNQTDRMSFTFSKVYGIENAVLFKANRYFEESKKMKSRGPSVKSNSSVLTGPQFEEQELGTTYQALRKLVVRSVTNSFSRTSGRVSKAWSAEATTKKKPTKINLAVVSEEVESDDVGDSGKTPHLQYSRNCMPLEGIKPQWDEPGWLDERLDMEGLCPAAVRHDAHTLNEMMGADENIKLSVMELSLSHRSKPFSEGSLRQASYARTLSSTDRFVVKWFKVDGVGLAQMAEDMRMQALCKAFALEFNGLLGIQPPLDFVVSSTLQNKSRSKNGHGCLSLEPFIDGEYVKYNNNLGWVTEDASEFALVAQAFSHFTFERSWGLLLVNDLQGVGHVLTDPSVQTKDTARFKLNATNLHEDSMKAFFATHECNPFCRKLDLKSSKEMFIAGNFEFRRQWPTMDPTVSCSNKLCRRIVRVAGSYETAEFPDHRWCSTCWPQLQTRAASCICTEKGPTHEFTVSRFFYESQGRVAPRKCPAHRDKDASETSAAAVGGSLWNRMKSPERTGTISGNVW